MFILDFLVGVIIRVGIGGWSTFKLGKGFSGWLFVKMFCILGLII